MILVFNFVLLVLFVGATSASVGLWVLACVRLYNGLPILDPFPRALPRVGLPELLIGFGVLGIVSSLLAPLIPSKKDDSNKNVSPVTAKLKDSITDDIEILPSDTESSLVSESTETPTGNQEHLSDANAHSETNAADGPAGNQPMPQPEDLEASDDDSVAEEIDTERLIPIIALNSVATVLAALAILAWLKLQGVSISTNGFLPNLNHLIIGFVASFMILPPVMILQAILASQIDYKHPLLDVLKTDIPWPVIVIMGISSSIIAPLVEEFYFRGILQGWLERLSVTFFRGGDEIFGPDFASQEPSNMPMISRPFWPTILASFAFAMVHYGQGPAPVSLFFLSLGIGYIYRQTGNIWPGIVVHFVLNATATVATVGATLL